MPREHTAGPIPDASSRLSPQPSCSLCPSSLLLQAKLTGASSHPSCGPIPPPPPTMALVRTPEAALLMWLLFDTHVHAVQGSSVSGACVPLRGLRHGFSSLPLPLCTHFPLLVQGTHQILPLSPASLAPSWTLVTGSSNLPVPCLVCCIRLKQILLICGWVCLFQRVKGLWVLWRGLKRAEKLGICLFWQK